MVALRARHAEQPLKLSIDRGLLAHGFEYLSDGELFYLIEHGVKITGMPAWSTGEAEGERATWRLVHFIRRLPGLTREEILEMEDLNPRGRREWRAFEEERRFLSGTLDVPDPLPGHPH